MKDYQLEVLLPPEMELAIPAPEFVRVEVMGPRVALKKLGQLMVVYTVDLGQRLPGAQESPTVAGRGGAAIGRAGFEYRTQRVYNRNSPANDKRDQGWHKMSKAKKLFGTDGIRGTANKAPMTPDIVLKVGQAMGYFRQQPHRKGEKRMVLIGKDTRLSGYMLEQALSSRLNSMGVGVQLTGPLPTPGIGFLARNMRVDAGIIISASRQPLLR